MIETIFAVIGVIAIIYFLYILTEEAIFKKYYKGLLEDLKETYNRVGEGNREMYSKEDIKNIIGLLHNRAYIACRYFEKEES